MTTEPELMLDMKYAENPEAALSIATYLLDKINNAPSNPWRSVTFLANKSAALMAAFLAGEPGAHLQLTESVTAAAGEDYFINGVSFEIQPGPFITATWHLMWDVEPTTTYWILQVSGRSELGDTTVLAP